MATASSPPPRAAFLAVVTVSYGSDGVLGPFLASLTGATTVPYEIIVADNKPSAGPSAIARLTADAGGAYLPMQCNRGYGHAINEAVRALPASFDWIVVSNPDVTVNVGAIDVLLEAVSNDPTIGAVGPRILSSEGQIYPSARTIPSLRSGVGHALFANIWPSNPWTRTYRRETGSELTRRDAGWLSGAFLMVRRTVFDDLNGFDENYFMYFEDVDLGYRIGRAGLRNVYAPEATVVHTGAHSTRGDESVRMIRAHHTSARRFLFKKYSGAWLWPVRLLIGAGLSVRVRLQSRRLR